MSIKQSNENTQKNYSHVSLIQNWHSTWINTRGIRTHALAHGHMRTETPLNNRQKRFQNLFIYRFFKILSKTIN